MGPTNTALVKLMLADTKLREAQARLDAASKNVRIQQRRVDDLVEKQRLSHVGVMELRSRSGQIELDLKTRDTHIDKLRDQQQNAKNNKEYQTFLVEINTQKVDKAKVEEELMTVMEQVETAQAQDKELQSQVAAEQAKLAALQVEIGGKLKTLEAELESLRPARDEAWNATPSQARDLFDRLADRHDGEALAALTKPDKRREEYVCGACHMELMIDVYNKLHSRDELIICPSCRRMLYIPEEMTPENAVNKKKIPKPKKIKEVAAVPPRQQSAMDVLNSIMPEADEPAEEPANTAQTPENAGTQVP